jgi:hypothetical protein
MQIAQPVESLQREREAGQQPDDEQAALVVVADMLQAITILTSLKPSFSMCHRLLAMWYRQRRLMRGEERLVSQ